jgi:hypothetical protein
MKKIILLSVMGLFLVSMCGCLAILAGGAAGAGTAFWTSDKLTQQFDTTYDRAVNAAGKALKSLNLEIAKQTNEAEVTQFRSKYTDGKEIWIDVRKITDNSTKVEVRVGVVKPNKEAATKILKRIENYL